jgi:hypothetical protein
MQELFPVKHTFAKSLLLPFYSFPKEAKDLSLGLFIFRKIL